MTSIKINEQIAFYRKQRGLTQDDLAKELGVSNQAVSKWESAQCYPDIQLLPAIAKCFNISVDVLLGYKNTAADDVPREEQFMKPEIIADGAVARMKDGLFLYSGWPSVCCDEEGTLYAVASSFRTRHICPFGKSAMYISRNNGKTWTPPIVINDTFLDDRDVGILYTGNGHMVITWFAHPTENYLGRYYDAILDGAGALYRAPISGMLEMYKNLPKDVTAGGNFIRVSEDYGVTWSDTVQIPISSPHGPTQLRDGSLLFFGKEQFVKSKSEEDEEVCAYVSYDGGYSWKKKGVSKKPDDLNNICFSEPNALELPDGTILGMIRADGVPGKPMTMYMTKSTDGGETWTPWECTDINGAPPHLMRHSSGAIVCSFGRREQPFGEQVVISYDNGATWSQPYMLHDQCASSDLGYTCSTELKDGSILSVYYQRAFDEQKHAFDAKTSILYTRWCLPKQE